MKIILVYFDTKKVEFLNISWERPTSLWKGHRLCCSSRRHRTDYRALFNRSLETISRTLNYAREMIKKTSRWDSRAYLRGRSSRQATWSSDLKLRADGRTGRSRDGPAWCIGGDGDDGGSVGGGARCRPIELRLSRCSKCAANGRRFPAVHASRSRVCFLCAGRPEGRTDR